MFVHGQKVLKRMIISECVISINFTEINQGVLRLAAKLQTGKTIRADFYEAAAIIWSNILQDSAIIFYKYTVQLLFGFVAHLISHRYFSTIKVNTLG